MTKGRRPDSINSPRRQSRLRDRQNERKPRRGATKLRFDIFDVGNHLGRLNPGLTSGVPPELSRRATDGERLRREVSDILVVRNMSE